MTPPEDGVPGPEPDLGPFLAELTGDLSSLERFPEPLVELLAAAGLSAGARVLDVACGKGAAALALAVKLGVEVDGVDEEDAYVLAAEAEARRRGCHHAWVDTQFGARGFYERLGYVAFGELPDYPPGFVRTFLRKTLTP